MAVGGVAPTIETVRSYRWCGAQLEMRSMQTLLRSMTVYPPKNRKRFSRLDLRPALQHS